MCALGIAITIKASKRPDLVRPVDPDAVVKDDLSPLHAHFRFNPRGIAPDAPQP
jgi:hypothetical protein